VILAIQEAVKIRSTGLEAGRANSPLRPYLKKNLSLKRAGGMAQGVGPEFKQYSVWQKTKKQKKTHTGLEVWLKW
jgi:hypothetical protein